MVYGSEQRLDIIFNGRTRGRIAIVRAEN
jgi:hypothetical protein